jgi:hypothetical protein
MHVMHPIRKEMRKEIGLVLLNILHAFLVMCRIIGTTIMELRVLIAAAVTLVAVSRSGA